MSKEIVFDIETLGDIKDFNSQKLTVVSIYQFENDQYRSFEESELGELWPLFEKAERLIGFNSEHFDLPILNRYYAGDLLLFPHLDLLKVIKETTGTRFKLNDLARATLQQTKSADGLQAQKWWQEGKKDEVKKYCEQDVRVTKDLYEYGRKNKMLYIETLAGDLQPIAVDFSLISEQQKNFRSGAGNINLTLPF